MRDAYEFQDQNEKLLATKQSQIGCIFAKKAKESPVSCKYTRQTNQNLESKNVEIGTIFQ